MKLTIEQAMQHGVTAQTKGNFQEAEGFYNAILRSLPQHPEANHNLGLLAVAVNNTEAALPYFKSALDAKPQIGQFWLSYIETLIRANQIETAKQILKQGQNSGLFGNRFDDLEKRLNGLPVAPSDLIVQQLLNQFNARHYAEAEKTARSIITKYPNHQYTWKVLGAALGSSEQHSEAIYANKKAIELAPCDVEAHNNLGNALKELERLEEATDSFQQAIKLKPDFADAHFNLGCTLNEMDKLKESEASFLQALEFQDNDEEFFANLGNVQHKLEKLEAAEMNLRKAIKLNPSYAEAFNGLGLTLSKLEKFDEAKRCLVKSLELNPNFSQAYNNLGVVLLSQNRIEESEKNVRKAITLDPNFAEAQKNLSALLKKQGKLNEAEISIRKALELKPNFAEAQNNLGSLLLLKGEFDQAEASFRQSILINSDNANAYYNLGMLFLVKEQYQQAIECFESSDFNKSKLYLLRCLYLIDEKNGFYELLDDFIEKGEVHPMIGSLVCRSTLRYKIEKSNLFCQDPLTYVLKTDLSTECDFKKSIVETAKRILNEDRIPRKIQGLLKNGYQTHGNLFEIEPDLTKEIQTLIHIKLEKYRTHFKESKEGLFSHWPKEYSLYGWLVNMKNGGELKAHMHENGWISGSIYINVPKKSTNESGNLVVCIEEQQLTNGNKNQSKSIDVVTGSLCLFPASLLHYTVPFEAEEERIVLAFDVVPIK